ncbi:VWA domain-containing protein [Spirosoma sp. BT702]|uniref:VWA domain-containing protein n=1 Tax=Spirosoma profusum TaxID=2771354 RepID=A0A927AW31_9BACT|nr:VWA domain-containing protein [Spirosoma profusum]MBD2705482.1 VWA domain-containing protein [Spirosoma profusum]
MKASLFAMTLFGLLYRFLLSYFSSSESSSFIFSNPFHHLPAPEENTTYTEVKDLSQSLEPKWYKDSDKNAIPDFIEQELGYNPTQDDCRADVSGCGEGATGEDLDFSVNTLLLFDASGSMAARLGTQTRMSLAKASLTRYVTGVPEAVRLGLLVYGHRGTNQESGKAESCAGISLLAPIGSLKEAGIQNTLSQFKPTGWTPIAAALLEARKSFQGLEGKHNRIIIVSDGLETCGGDPVAVARQLHESGLEVNIDVIGLHVPGSDAQQLRKIAQAGGGYYYDARSQRELDAYFEKQQLASQKTLQAALCYVKAHADAGQCDQRMVLKATDRIYAERRKFTAAGDIAKANALIQIRVQVTDAHNRRKKEREPILVKYNELKSKGNAILSNTLKTNERLRR